MKLEEVMTSMDYEKLYKAYYLQVKHKNLLEIEVVARQRDIK